MPQHFVPPFCPLYVARGRRIGCEGATDRLPHGPRSTQRPLNSEGRRAPLTDRARTVARDAGEAGEPASAKAGPRRVEGSTEMKETPTYAGIDVVAKDRLDVVLRPSGGYVEATNDERGIGSLVRRLHKEDVTLAVLEATGGLEQPAAAALAVAGVPVAIVNPRQVRDFAKATGKLAKTDRIDAAVLAHFAEAVRPEPRPLADEHARELSAVLLRRRQILAMTTAEGNRASTAPKAVRRRRIEAHLRWLRKELARIDGELERAVKESLWCGKTHQLGLCEYFPDSLWKGSSANFARVGVATPRTRVYGICTFWERGKGGIHACPALPVPSTPGSPRRPSLAYRLARTPGRRAPRRKPCGDARRRAGQADPS